MKILSILVFSTIALMAQNPKVVWQDTPSNALYKMSFKRALSYCNTLTHDNHSNWRLPSLKEFTSIIDKNRIPTIKSTFNYSSVGCYWSYTNNQIGSINFQEATTSNHIRSIDQECFARCVYDK